MPNRLLVVPLCVALTLPLATEWSLSVTAEVDTQVTEKIRIKKGKKH